MEPAYSHCFVPLVPGYFGPQWCVMFKGVVDQVVGRKSGDSIMAKIKAMQLEGAYRRGYACGVESEKNKAVETADLQAQ